LTCEAPIYAAYEKGFFKEEGLEPELVKCNWSTYKDALALGSYDITHHLIMYFHKPIDPPMTAKKTVIAFSNKSDCLYISASISCSQPSA